MTPLLDGLSSVDLSSWALSGIPQDYVLGPLLFLLSIFNSSSQLFLLVDDANLFRSIVKQSDFIQLQRDLYDLHPTRIKYSQLSQYH